MGQNRRSFIKKAGLAGAALAGAARSVAQEAPVPYEILKPKPRTAPGQTLNIAVIGAGGMGTVDVNTALEHEGIRIVAACDLYDGRLEAAKEKWGKDLFLTKNYKDILKRKDVDMVIIGTPDHWHKAISIDAMKAGKHVYCEKPMVHSAAGSRGNRRYQLCRRFLGPSLPCRCLAIPGAWGCQRKNGGLGHVHFQYHEA